MENNSNTLKKKFDEPLECPHCGAENKPTFTLHIDAKDTRIVKKLLDRKLFEFKCNKCKQKYIYEYFFEYIDEENSIDILALTIPKTSANQVAQLAVEAGIKGIWNFAHMDLTVPEGVVVENVHLSESLMTLSYNLGE